MKRAEQPKNRQNIPLSNDERIVNRTNERRKKNRRKKMIIRAVLLISLFAIGVFLVMLLFFNINKISVTGDTIYSAEEIIEASEIEQGDNLIFLSKKKINELVTKKLPYVGEVKIKRRLPAHLEIQIIKTEGCFAVAQGEQYVILDYTGKVLETNAEKTDENLILLNAGGITSAVAGEKVVFEDENLFIRAQEVYDLCQKVELNDITSMDVTELNNIKLKYQDRIIIEMGETSGDKLKRKLELSREAIERQNEEDSQFRGTLNLKIDKKPYLSPEETEEETPKEEKPVEPTPKPEVTPQPTPETENPTTANNGSAENPPQSAA